MDSPLIEYMMGNAEEYNFSKAAQKVGFSEILHTNRYFLIESPRPITQLNIRVENELSNFQKIALNK